MKFFSVSFLAAPSNRGALLDVLSFLCNCLIVFALGHFFAELAALPRDGAASTLTLGSLFFFIVIAQPVAGLLKRRRAHQRMPSLALPDPQPLFWIGFYFLHAFLFALLAGTDLGSYLSPGADSSTDDFGVGPGLFMTLFLAIPLAAALSTWVTYLYFDAPSPKPWFAWLNNPRSEFAADLILYVNMLLQQILWGFIMRDLTTDFPGLANRLFYFSFAAIVMYFPPRLFYLAEDAHHRRTWLTMLFANSPLLFAIFFR